jgi:hypothetical protein
MPAGRSLAKSPSGGKLPVIPDQQHMGKEGRWSLEIWLAEERKRFGEAHLNLALPLVITA